jgi:hypothetical protein
MGFDPWTNRYRDDEEYPRAYVVAAPGASVSEDDIIQFVNNKVSTIKRLTGGVVFTDAIPKAPVRATQMVTRVYDNTWCTV